MSLETSKSVKESDEIDLGRLIGELIDHRKLIVSVTALCTLIALVYAIFSTPVYQADALIQIEQKQGNTILSSLSQMLPDSQPQSAPEIALIQSRMILGKTVDDLNLQAEVKQNHFPVFGNGWARISGDEKGELSVSRFYLAIKEDDAASIKLTVLDDENYIVEGDGFRLKVKLDSCWRTKGFLLG